MPGQDGEARDKVTVGLTTTGAANLTRLVESGWFKTELDAYRIAISVALARGLVAHESEMAGVRTKFNVGSLDPDGRLRSMVALLVPSASQRPYEYAEQAAIAGLKYLSDTFIDNNLLLSEVLLGVLPQSAQRSNS